MFIITFLLCFVLKVVQSQLNGEFWWLDEKVAEYNHVLITPPIIEHISELDTDENANIVFRDDNDLMHSDKDKSRNKMITTTESVRLNSGNNDIDVDLIWPIQNKDNNENKIAFTQHLSTVSTSTINANHNVRNLNESKDLPFVFPNSDTHSSKNKYQTNENAASVSASQPVTNFNNVNSAPINNHPSEGRIYYDNAYTNLFFDDRPKFSNINVANIVNNFETQSESNVNISANKIDPDSAQGINLTNPYSLVISPLNKIHSGETKKSYFNDKPKFSNDDVINMETKSFDSKNNSKINESTDKVIPAIVQFQNIKLNHPNNMADDENKNNKFDDRPKFGNVYVSNIQNYNLLLPEKNTQLSNVNSKNDNFVFGKPSWPVTQAITTSMKPNIKNETKTQFTFPKGDNIIWDDIPVPTKTTEKASHIYFTYNNLNDKTKFQNINDDVTNKNVVSPNGPKTSEILSNYQVINPSSNQSNGHVFTYKEKDDFAFTYPPEDKIIFPEQTAANTANYNQASSVTNPLSEVPKHGYLQPLTIFGNDQISDSEIKEPESQNICNYMEKDKCQLKKGFVYTLELQIMLAKKAHDPDLICCILPSTDHIASEDYSKVTFVNNPETSRLQKRSTSDDETIEQKQRKVLLERLLLQTRNLRLPATRSRVVTPDDDYPDPYWNIKNTKFQDTQAQNTRTRYGESSKDYIEDYVDELPKPGLLGIYSDTVPKKRNPSWQFINRKPATTYGVDVVYDSVESDETFGYSTVDPRRVVSSKPKNGTPAKLSTASDDKQSFHPESEIVSFQSNPDFKVFQGFKLINYAKKKNKHTKTSLTDVEDETESKESEEKIVDNVSESDDYNSKEETQIFENCGRAVEIIKTSRKDKQTGEADSGSHPWLGLVVETKRRFNILCYATIIHPRIAITAAQCVFGTTLGEITIIAGLWNLNERTRSRSRVVSIHVHPEYVPGDLVNDLAILYWQHPLRLGVNVQPACLASHDVNEGCMFFGWGGFEAIRPRSRWQKATIRECKEGQLANKENESEDLFCASLPQSRTSVIAKGSPLVCNIEGRYSMVGFVVSNEDGVVLLSAQNWATRAVKKLQLV